MRISKVIEVLGHQRKLERSCFDMQALYVVAKAVNHLLRYWAGIDPAQCRVAASDNHDAAIHELH
jgi:hypothetical protein